MNWFDYAAPQSVEDAISLFQRHGKYARGLAGGTDLLVQMREGRRDVDVVIDLKNIPALNELRYDEGDGLLLGAAVPCYRIYEDPVVRRVYPALAHVASIIGGTQIQGRASIGGNLCNAAPSADAVPLLIALDVQCRTMGPGGERTIATEDFCIAPGKTVLEPGEILVSLRVPVPKAGAASHYLRFTPRNEMDIAVAGAGVAVEMEEGRFRTARVALSSVAPTPLFVREAGEFLAGQPANEEAIARAAEIAAGAARPISDMRGTAEYRRHLCNVLTRRALQAAVTEAANGSTR